MYFIGGDDSTLTEGSRNPIKESHNRAVAEEARYYSLSKRVFRVLAPFYDVAFELLSFGAVSRLREHVVDITDLHEGSLVLDVATGTGGQALAFARRGIDVAGVDLSRDMLEIATQKNVYGNVWFEVADATKLPFENEVFDAACVSFALHDMVLTIIEKVLTEMVRVTKTNGTIIIVDYDLPKESLRRTLLYNFVRLYEVYYSEFIKQDFEALLRKSGIETKEKHSVLLGAIRILRGIKMEEKS